MTLNLLAEILDKKIAETDADLARSRASLKHTAARETLSVYALTTSVQEIAALETRLSTLKELRQLAGN